MMVDKRAFGIDISYAQQTFSPPPAAESDLDFVILKASQANFPDPRFAEFYPAALAVPIRGAYHYFITSRVTTTGTKAIKGEKNKKAKKEIPETVEIPGFTWQEQAAVFLKQVKDKDIHFFALDLEIVGGTDPRSGKRITNKYSRADVLNIRSWVDEVKKRTGKPVLLYTRATVFGPNILANGGEILKDLDLWVARYPDDPSTGASGDPYEGNSSVKIPGVSGWRFWQYSDRNNGKGARYGTATASVDLDVYNGTVEELRSWLGLEAVAIVQKNGDGKELSKPERSVTVKQTMDEVIAQLDAIKQASLIPIVRIDLRLDRAGLQVFEDLLAKLQEASIAPQVRFDLQSDPHREASIVTGKGEVKPSAEEEVTDEVKPTREGAQKPSISTPRKEDSFTVVVKPKRGKNTALQSFNQKTASGKPIMVPLDILDHRDRITRTVGDLLRVSATHKVSVFDKGDGKIRGADGRDCYYITDDLANGNAAGLYVLEPDVQRV